MAGTFGKIPAGALKSPIPFKIAIPESQLAEFRTLLELSRIAAPTYESLQEDGKYGLTHKWITEAKDHWLNNFNWYDSHVILSLSASPY